MRSRPAGAAPDDSFPDAAERGSAAVLLVAVLMALTVGAVVLGGIGAGIGRHAEAQRAADLAALAGARAMLNRYPRLFDAGAPLPKAAYFAAGVAAATDVARRNGAHDVRIAVPDGDSFAPVRLRVRVDIRLGRRDAEVDAAAEAQLAPGAGLVTASGGGYDGPLASRQGKLMRPDVALAFDRLERAARADGVALIVVSAFRSDAEQARLFAARPDPRWVAPPGKSLHRLGTELDLGPASAYGWLAANAPRFGFIKRYSWEPWHWGYSRNPGTTSVGYGRRSDGERGSALPQFVPARFAPAISRAAQRWNVGAALLAAQLYAESNFNPFARSPAGAQGIAQFMPGTARAYGLANPFDAEAAIDAQARLMRDLLRQFASVPLALAAYNAGPAPVRACGCVPPYPETRGYVARILGLLGGAGDLTGGGGLEVRLVA